ncbi:MAG: alpha/beta hydrolase [Ichthyobacteriaceae bacterium]|nr:alpha/beta hydrolase [Ichthyobacteriaceae bacterium]
MKKVNSILLSVAFVATLSSCEQNMDNQSVEVLNENEVLVDSSFYTPQTMSKEAQEIVSEWNIVDRNKNSGFPKADAGDKVWSDHQAKFNEMAMEWIPGIIEDLGTTVDTIMINGVRAIDVKPKNYKKSDKVLLYVHGGAYVVFTADVTLASSAPLADLTGLRVISLDYTLAPQADFKQITDEFIKFYKGVMEMGYKPENISLYGDSAGGGLAAGGLLKARDLGIDMPSSLVLWSPWTDIDEVGDTYSTLADNDPNLVYKGFLDHCALAYAGSKDNFKNPYVSPVYGDFSKDFPPTLIQVGGKEIFLSNAIRMHRVLDNEDIEVKLDVYEGMWHVFQGYYKVPEAQIALKNTKKFMFKHFNK